MGIRKAVWLHNRVEGYRFQPERFLVRTAAQSHLDTAWKLLNKRDVLLSYAAEIRQFGLDPDSSFFPIDPIAGQNPTRVLVESSAISSIFYDPKSQTLDIEFKTSGEIYRYFDVPNDEYQALLMASSKGAYLNSQIKPKYRTRKIL